MTARRPGAFSAARPVALGFAALAILVIGLGGWSAMARISGAVVTGGMIEVEGNRQAVQHPDGGVIGDIRVIEGQDVTAGEVLLRFDDTLLRSELAIIEAQLFEGLARKARLVAERDGADAPEFAPDLLAAATGSRDVQELIDGQRQLFFARRDSAEAEADQLRERIRQIERQIEGVGAQIAALSEQRSLIGEELADQQSLLERGLTQAGRVLALKRESARLGGLVGELQAREAQARAQISETGIQILRLTSTLREEAIAELRDLEVREFELRERRLAMLETLSRLDVRAPVSGIVYGRQVNSVGAVVRPADVLMYVVPQDEPLVIAARIETIHIDQVRVGQAASLRFPAFDQRMTPEIEGVVTRVSADAFTDQNTGIAYYTAELLPLPGETDKLGDRQLLPGMPVEAYIRTGERTPLNYLVKPLADYFNRAFRET
ncbi:HlyD family type I secretion periplasmic adaptor subunit [Halovulum dunhuangense]|uniref:Membrane fusion protein (MFP) family protein n=1 Tax=Halovulum dunhuangense TaxID=1505036 RepID=A0A849L5W1_9RHOB|nr:HlyD family type I secretion periplasmic adaptor subunit [Halovulum dunhuangense]NNU81643.1 HlyD family type I secretion periplasmic adaptor subunit [Halovulum dunhuangense]